MKKLLAISLAAAMLASLVACGGSGSSSEAAGGAEQETLTGSAQGYGGTVTVTVVREGDTLVSVTAEGADETDGIGTPALEELPAAILAAGGVDGIDVVAGATVTSNAIIAAYRDAVGEEAPASEEGDEEEVEIEYTSETFSTAAVGAIGEGVRLGQSQYNPHGTRSFAVVSVLLDGDVVLDAYIDEFQFMNPDVATALPNGDTGFGERYGEEVTNVLVSKRDNNDAYSESMTNNGGATMELVAGYEAIEAFVIGKTVAELEEVVNDNDDEAVIEIVDAVASVTLVDTSNYIRSIIEAARKASTTDALDFSGNTANLSLGRSISAPHGSYSFAVVSAVVDGSTVIGAYIDEFQPMTGAVVGVPNSNDAFGENWEAGYALVSKRVNDTTYSANMAERGGATMGLAEGYEAIETFVAGQTIAELEAVAGMEAEEAIETVDAVASVTLADTANYIGSIVEAAKNA